VGKESVTLTGRAARSSGGPANGGPQVSRDFTRSGPAVEDDPKVKSRLAFIDICRAISALLVFYSHISVLWVRERDVDAPVIKFIDGLTSNPMHMSNQGIGQIGVPIFFLVSGFVVTPIALRMGSLKFGLNRLLRIYPPLIVTVLLAATILSIGLKPLSTGQDQTVNFTTIITNTTLANYFLVPQIVFVGVAWTLIVEIIFYLLLMALIPVLRNWTWLAIAIELTFVLVVLMSRRELGSGYFLFSASVSFLPIIIIGQIVWAVKDKKIPLWAGGAYVAGAWGLYVLADVIQLGRLDTSYNLALAFAVVCFLLAMFAEAHLRERAIWVGLSERAYSLYLLHGVTAFATLDLLQRYLPFYVSIFIAVGVTFGMVELCYRFVEKPSHQFARKISRRGLPRPDPEPVREQQREWPAEREEEPVPARDDRTVELPPVRRPRPAEHRAQPSNGRRRAPSRGVEGMSQDRMSVPQPRPLGAGRFPPPARPAPPERRNGFPTNGFPPPDPQDEGYRPRHARRQPD
jgi:peptidoglycan/LPS O-acetylase OafA/YrhL